jgi:hypothetical protein
MACTVMAISRQITGDADVVRGMDLQPREVLIVDLVNLLAHHEDVLSTQIDASADGSILGAKDALVLSDVPFLELGRMFGAAVAVAKLIVPVQLRSAAPLADIVTVMTKPRAAMMPSSTLPPIRRSA